MKGWKLFGCCCDILWGTIEQQEKERVLKEKGEKESKYTQERTNRAQLEQISKKGIQTNAFILFIFFLLNEWITSEEESHSQLSLWSLSPTLSLSLYLPHLQFQEKVCCLWGKFPFYFDIKKESPITH